MTDPLSPSTGHMTNEERLSLALQAGGIGLWDYDPQTKLLHGSAAISTPDHRLHDISMPLAEFLAMISPQHRTDVERAMVDVLANGVTASAIYELTRPDGQVRWIQAHVYPVLDDRQQVSRLIGITRDITEAQHALIEREALLVEMASAKAIAEQAVTRRNNFISSTVHDLRTPLTSIRGRVQLMQRRLRKLSKPDETLVAMEEGLGQIERSVQQAVDMLSELQDLAFLEIGRPLELRLAPHDLVALVREVVETMQILYPSCSFRFVAAEASLILTMDDIRIRRAMTNLVTNAAKYSGEGRTVTVTIASRSPWAEVRVADEGIGIPASELGRVFERYFRASNVTDSREGTGVGLAGTRQIVIQHGGEIAVESEEGTGSIFTIRLPMAVAM